MRLIRLRRAKSQTARAVRNVREEANAAISVEAAHGAGSAYEAGYATGRVSQPNAVRAVREALELGLPDDLAELCRSYLGAAA